MKWIIKPSPAFGAERIIKKFAWFPIWISNEIVWFEMVRILQVYRQHWRYKSLGDWTNVGFLKFGGSVPKMKNPPPPNLSYNDSCDHIWKHVLHSDGDYFQCEICKKKECGFFTVPNSR